MTNKSTLTVTVDWLVRLYKGYGSLAESHAWYIEQIQAMVDHVQAGRTRDAGAVLQELSTDLEEQLKVARTALANNRQWFEALNAAALRAAMDEFDTDSATRH